MNEQLLIEPELLQFEKFPGTRYMGSKNKIITALWDIMQHYQFDSFFDAFGGSNVVGYFMKAEGKRVVSNDFMKMSYYGSKAIIENNNETISEEELTNLIETPNSNSFIQDTFDGIYFNQLENEFLDKVRGNINNLNGEYKKAIAISALVRACMKKRPRGIFTYTGERYNDGRKDIKTSLKQHFLDNVQLFNNAVFSNGKDSNSNNQEIFDVEVNCDLVYLDPPYYNPKGDNDYVRRYHFVEGLATYWEGIELQQHTKTKKFKSYKSPFSVKKTAYEAFDSLISKYRNSIIAISYSSNSLPNKDEMIEIIGRYKPSITTHEISHTYSFGNQNHKIGNQNNKVKEYLFIAQ